MRFALQIRVSCQNKQRMRYRMKMMTIYPLPTNNGVTSCPPWRKRAEAQTKILEASKSYPSNYDIDASHRNP